MRKTYSNLMSRLPDNTEGKITASVIRDLLDSLSTEYIEVTNYDNTVTQVIPYSNEVEGFRISPEIRVNSTKTDTMEVDPDLKLTIKPIVDSVYEIYYHMVEVSYGTTNSYRTGDYMGMLLQPSDDMYKVPEAKAFKHANRSRTHLEIYQEFFIPANTEVSWQPKIATSSNSGGLEISLEEITIRARLLPVLKTTTS